MRQSWTKRVVVALVVAAFVGVLTAGAQDNPLDKSKSTWKRPADWAAIAADPAKLDAFRAPLPTEFAFVFSWGYAGDDIGAHGPKFEALLKKVKESGHNVIHCTYTPERLEACRQAGVKMMVQMLDEGTYHVYKTVEKNPVLGKTLEGDPAVWGYNIWNDVMGKKTMIPGRQRDIRNVRLWDPSHPAYMGGYRTTGMSSMTMADCPGYYDFHWSRGIGGHFGHLSYFLNLARRGNSYYYSWFGTGSGAPGEDNFRKNLWSTNTGIAFGLKGVLWFLSDGVVNKNYEFGPLKDSIQKVHAAINPMGREIMKIGNPTAVYGTMVTKDMHNKPVEPAAQCPGTTVVPADFVAQPQAGEFVMGAFKDNEKRDVLYVANYNAFAPQAAKIKFAAGKKVSVFDVKTAGWKDATLTDGVYSFPLEAAAGLMLRVE